MAFNKDSIAGTMVFTIVLCLVCSFMITGTADVLKERKLTKKRDELMRNVLVAANIEGVTNDNFRDIFKAKVQPMLVNLETGEPVAVDNVLDYDANMAAINPETSSKISKDIAKIKTRANNVRIFKVNDDQGQLQALVLPVYGKGLWSIIYGFIGMEKDLNTVQGIVFYEHGETPGIGDFVNHEEWRMTWHGKQIYNSNGDVALKIVKGGAKPGDLNGVDGVSGATRTGAGVEKLIQFWFGKEGYEPLLEKLKAAGV
ncbi:Na(+)-translocating NADH-quinone reductase subunit C [Shewanella sp. A3A]|uniref:Na(+)-translocating NADH-quinone reductase subunit C n=1 Tax=Shewanella electrica TaxID=515560 RepID=A0ABT2FSC9_9GAMM|nr:Na(+)-translocating NADH-quinone reductase subunit C [Shewanella electrica]MCH1919079.1 Na(+)-translocating NADH-quinone reductase subunit C [Shewanella ferrihydritica]MCH1926949.1 Na(+)-translocating NADH-quinone reductase subunit C [Shewanella electrica]MCS4558570.1 Na(+)-translocating NADH-quinone reductase subunit C [Shewanella electrica]